MASSSGVKNLNLFELPLTGRTLIEASAGTGKTYSLAFIYLRLLLGIGKNSYGDPLTVDKILVVTFTKAATQELRSRIRQNIHELRMGLLQGEHSDPIYQQLIDLINDRKKAIRILTEAQQAMDEAAIYTIHGFCQRILTTHAFESGVLFEQTLVADEQQLRLQVVQDFWRHYFTRLDKSLVYLILQSWQDPVSLLSDISPYLNLESNNAIATNFDIVATIQDFYQHNIEQINAIKQAWQTSVDELESVIVKSGVSKQSYSSRNLPNWIEKVSAWVASPTLNFKLPPALTNFSQAILIAKTKDGKIAPTHKVFEEIEQLLSEPIDLKSKILMDIVAIIRQGIHDEKMKRGEMGFDDLLSLLHRALKSSHGDQLAKSIAAKYCVAMIDEFQDTDPIQYKIFDRIYHDQKNTGLLFIGDPKQAIYSFRGADIFTYINAKKSIEHSHYTMDINWRSSLAMVNSVNQLFANHDNPFVFDAIPFLNMKAADKNHQKGFVIHDEPVKALNAYLLSGENVTVENYTAQMANCCAEQIVTWLSDGAMLVNGKEKELENRQRRVIAADIAILVRKRDEAEIIQQQLAIRGIKSVYLSDRNSVFSSLEAKEILCLLQAALMPENETTLRTALMTQLLGLSMSDIETIAEDQDRWESIVEEFKQYQAVWLHYGVLVMLRRMMKKRQLAENILAHQYGERILTNFMHLGELLQEASYELDSPHALIRWLAKQITHPDLNLENHEQRLESDENLVKIITIHKSKGLEFPLVWLPFIAQYRDADTHFYHDKESKYQQKYAWQLTDEIKQQINNERLAEDLRLLYVAITRSIYHCSIGLATIKKGGSAINYLLHNELNKIADIAELIEVTSSSRSYYQSPEVKSPLLSANTFQRKLSNSWRVTSYTELQKQNHTVMFNSDLENEWDEYQESDDVDNTTAQQYDIYHFPKGTHVGTLLHKMMERITPDNIAELSNNIITQLNLAPEWLPILTDWVQGVLATPLNQQNQADKKSLILSQILQGNCINELQFYLPIRRPIVNNQLDQLCKEYDRLSRLCPVLDFDTVQGMLKGFIDLVFEWQGKFYVVDYKSNWLGDSADDYGQESLNKVMCEHRYELQYQLYTLALHRFLKSRLPNYQYSQHMGGVYYLFLRGMPSNGIFYHLPDEQFIEKLDCLFDGEKK